MKRTLLIGDIHGGLRALNQVMERAGVTTDDTLVFLGDLVDGWSQSAQTVDAVMDIATRQDCIFIKGNHDEWCEDWLRTGIAAEKWLPHGGQETVNSYATYSEQRKKEHLIFYQQMAYYAEDEHNRLYIHAGFTSMHGPHAEFHSSNFSWDRTLWEMALVMDKQIQPGSPFYPKRFRLYSEIYIGHTPTTNYGIDIPMHGGNVWNVDTGAAFTGKLTILDQDTKKFWQSDPLPQLYPGEKGRNRD